MVTLEFAQRAATIDKCLDRSRGERNRSIIAVNGFRRPFQGQERISMTEVSFGVVRLEYESMLEADKGFPVPPEQTQGICAVDQGIDIFRPVRQGAIIALQCILGPAEID